jgi:hypothetical protein
MSTAASMRWTAGLRRSTSGGFVAMTAAVMTGYAATVGLVVTQL